VFVDNDGNTITDERGNPIGDADEAQTRSEGVGQGVWRNYDFTPGRRVVYASDWESGRVGRIPQDIVFVSGNMELVELNGENVLEIKARSVFQVQLGEATPETFRSSFMRRRPLRMPSSKPTSSRSPAPARHSGFIPITI
jgi:hypothetical protein